MIYKVVNKINGKVYIGQTSTSLAQRKTVHCSEAKSERRDYVFYKALKKYGRENFIWSILCKCKEGKVSDFLEKFFIQKYESFYGTGKGYNMTPGGKGNSGKRSLRTRQLLSEKGKRPQKEETKIKISEGLKQSYALGERDSRGMLGKKHTEKTKNLISEKLKGNTGKAKEWKVIYNGKEVIIKDATKWCKENKYSYFQAIYRIKHNIDLCLENQKGKHIHVEKTKQNLSKKLLGNVRRARIWNLLYSGNNITIKNLDKWCRENNYPKGKAEYRILRGISL